jgi:hypothetical protein
MEFLRFADAFRGQWFPEVINKLMMVVNESSLKLLLRFGSLALPKNHFLL